MKKQTFNKAAGAALSLAMLLSSAPAFAENVKTDGVFWNDFRTTSSAWSSEIIGNENGMIMRTVTDDTAHGNVSEIYSPGVSGTEWGMWGGTAYTLADPAEREKLLISYDVKSTNVNTHIEVAAPSGNYTETLAFANGMGYIFNNWSADFKPEVESDKWTHVDLVIDQAAKTGDCYMNGRLLKSETAYNLPDTIGSVRVKHFASGTEGRYSRLDNVKVSVLKDSSFAPIQYTYGENAAYVLLSSTLPEGKLPDATVKLLGTEDAAEGVTVTKEGADILKIDYSHANLVGGAEYLVELATPVLDILGRSLDHEIVFDAPTGMVETTVTKTGFEEENTWRSDTVGAWPANWENISAWGNPVEIGHAAEPGKDSNHVIKFMEPFADNAREKKLKYTLPENLPDECELKISYRTKIHAIENDGADQTTITFRPVLTQSGNESFMIAENYYNGFDAHNGGLTISTGSAWAQNGGQTLLAADQFQFDSWYTMEYTYHLDGINRATVDYAVKNESGDVVAEATGKNAPGTLMTKPDAIVFVHYDGSGTKQAYTLLDDFSVSYTTSEAAAPAIRLIGMDDSALLPKATVSNSFKGFDVQFAEGQPEDSVTATLTSGTETINFTAERLGDGREWKYLLSSFLKPNTNYTFTMTYGNNDTYSYRFTTSAADQIEFADFGFYRADGSEVKKISELSDGEVITVRATVYNATGEDKKVCVSAAAYEKDFMKDVNYDEKTVDGSMNGTVLSANVTYHTGMDQLCGFFWDGISTLKPYMDKIEL